MLRTDIFVYCFLLERRAILSLFCDCVFRGLVAEGICTEGRAVDTFMLAHGFACSLLSYLLNPTILGHDTYLCVHSADVVLLPPTYSILFHTS